MDKITTPEPSTPNPHGPLVQRLSRPFPERLHQATLYAILPTAALGILHASQTSAMRFRAENSHHLPTTKRGWYLYHKSKMYAVVRASLKEGFAMGGKTGIGVACFVSLEEGVDRGRLRLKDSWEGREVRDVWSTALAGMGTAAGFSLWSQFSWIETARMVRRGGLAGLCIGLFEDAVTLAQGHRLAYVDFIKRMAGFATGKSFDNVEQGVT